MDSGITIDEYNHMDNQLVNNQVLEISSVTNTTQMKVVFVNYWYKIRVDLTHRINDKNLRNDRMYHVIERQKAWIDYLKITLKVPANTEESIQLFRFN